jgi:hypothetical protein
MATISIRTRITGGHVVDETITETAPLLTVLQPVTALAAAKSGALKTRLDDDAAVISCATSGFGIASGDPLDVFWSNTGYRFGMQASAISGNCFSICSGYAGLSLPASGTVLAVGPISTYGVSLNGATSPFVCAEADRLAGVTFFHSLSGIRKAKCLPANTPWYRAESEGEVNPISNAVDQIRLSNGDATGTNNITVQYLHTQS